MPEHSSMHLYLNWAMERIDEMDAALASLEAQAGQVGADCKSKADRLIADLKTRREEFEANFKKNAQEGEAAWHRAKGQLETEWQGFEARVKAYLETVAKQVDAQQATFRNIAAAQMQAWQEAAHKLLAEASKTAGAKRADIAAVVEKMKSDAAEAEACLQPFKQARSESWAALSAALAESRKAFDRASQQAWDAVKRAAPAKT
jgi:hypothetical protein